MAKFAAPLYSAATVWSPGLSAAVVHVACPLAFSGTALQPVITLTLSLNVTLPSLAPGVPAPSPVPVTVAVKVTDVPSVDGLLFEVTTVDVARLLTVCPPASVPVLSAKFAPFRYSAVMGCGEPAAVSAAVEHCAWPEALTARLLQLVIAAPSADRKTVV